MIPETSDVFLSPAGQARRAAMRSTLTREVQRLGERRWRARAGGTGLVLVAAALLGWRVMAPPGRDAAAPATTAGAPVSEPVASLTIELIDDQTLLALLAEAGRPSTLARIDGHAVVIPVWRPGDRAQ